MSCRASTSSGARAPTWWSTRPLNPDFSQVELDTPQLAGNAQFALYYQRRSGRSSSRAPTSSVAAATRSTRARSPTRRGARAPPSAASASTARCSSRGTTAAASCCCPEPTAPDYAAQDFKSLATFARGRWQVGGDDRRRLVSPTARYEDGAATTAWPGPTSRGFPTASTAARAGAGFVDDGAARCGGRAVGRATLRVEPRGARGLESTAAPRGRSSSTSRTWAASFRADNGFFGQNGYRALYSETQRQFLDAGPLQRGLALPQSREYKTDRDGNVHLPAEQPGRALGLPRATTILLECAPQQPRGGPRGRRAAQARPVLRRHREQPLPLVLAALLGARLRRPRRRRQQPRRQGRLLHRAGEPAARIPRAELEYRIDNDTIDSPRARGGVEAHHRPARAAGARHLALHGARQPAHHLAAQLHAPRALALGGPGLGARQQRHALGRLRAPCAAWERRSTWASTMRACAMPTRACAPTRRSSS